MKINSPFKIGGFGETFTAHFVLGFFSNRLLFSLTQIVSTYFDIRQLDATLNIHIVFTCKVIQKVVS